jgi:hypothetical protein
MGSDEFEYPVEFGIDFCKGWLLDFRMGENAYTDWPRQEVPIEAYCLPIEPLEAISVWCLTVPF